MKKGKISRRKSVSKPTAKKMGHRVGAMKRGGIKGAGRPVERTPPGYVKSPGSAGLLIPQRATVPVPAGKLRAGIREVKQQIDETLNELIESLTGNYEIKEIKLVASFSADGKFLGFGVGGAVSMEITICPCE